MSDERNDGGPAFPVPPNEEQQKDVGWSPYSQGMSLRDYFAGQRAAGMSRPAVSSFYQRLRRFLGLNFDRSIPSPQSEAIHCYEFADEMLKAREK